MSQKRKRITLSEKVKIIDEHKTLSVNQISYKYNIAKSSVCTILKNKTKILKHLKLTHNTSGKIRSIRKGEFPKMERKLYKWFVVQRANHITMSGAILKCKAKQLHAQYYRGAFNASDGWLTKFKKRFGIRLLKISGEKLSAHVESVDPFKISLKSVIEQHQLCRHAIFNADETGLYYKALPGSTYVTNAEKTAPGRKMYKERVTFLACTNASGSKKIKPLIIGKSKKPRSFKNKKLPLDYFNSKSAWMTALLFKKWFFEIFVIQVEDFLQNMGLPKKAILILDNAPSHPPAEELVKETDGGKIWVIYMPPNVTPLIQPMDQNAIRLTKLFYRDSLLSRIVSSNCSNVAEALKKLTLYEAVLLLALAWEKVTANAIQKCWNNLLDEDFDEEDDVPLSILKVNDEISAMSHTVDVMNQLFPQTNITVESILQWTENETKQTFEDSTNDIEDHISIDDEDERENLPPAPPKEKHSEIVNMFGKCIKWAEENDVESSKTCVLLELQGTASHKAWVQSTNFTQPKIKDFFKK